MRWLDGVRYGPCVRRRALVLFLLFLSAACAPRILWPGPDVTDPVLDGSTFTTADGAQLPVRSWAATDTAPKAVIIALHGFNDYSNFINDAAGFFAGQGFTTYAYDQRGFGRAADPGLWPGTDTFARDLGAVTAEARRRHPGTPVYLLGASMGGAVVITAMTGDNPPDADGVILSAPAVWGRPTMPWYQSLALDLSAHVLPWLTLTGEGLNIQASDNIEMLRALGRDPLVIRNTRIDTMYGLANLMDAALEASASLDVPALFLLGAKDEVIPSGAFKAMLCKLPQNPKNPRRFALYADGWHMLMRDLQAETVWRDIAAWVTDGAAPLPSGADRQYPE